MKREIIEGWLRKAENDLQAAEKLLSSEEILTDVIC